MWSAKNGTGSPVAMQRHLDWSTWYGFEQRTFRWGTCSQSIIGWMSCLYSRTLFLIETTYPVQERTQHSNLCTAFFLTSLIWGGQVSVLSSVTPRYRSLSTHWIGSLKSCTGQGLGMRLPVLVKSIMVLFKTVTATVHSLCHQSRLLG